MNLGTIFWDYCKSKLIYEKETPQKGVSFT